MHSLTYSVLYANLVYHGKNKDLITGLSGLLYRICYRNKCLPLHMAHSKFLHFSREDSGDAAAPTAEYLLLFSLPRCTPACRQASLRSLREKSLSICTR
ncbi:MAG: hypothetical protein BGP14_24435 [Sphingobacteriales bacterium 44-15]|nr:MAG: hypothetical protein BGP14_24435 [Sphingobacteriales bacterium 44-15]